MKPTFIAIAASSSSSMSGLQMQWGKGSAHLYLLCGFSWELHSLQLLL
jgi:hypothetical protein